jgi:hypothetical protein
MTAAMGANQQDDPNIKIARLEAQLDSIARSFKDFVSQNAESLRLLREDINRLAGLIENGKLISYQISEAASERTELRQGLIQLQQEAGVRSKACRTEIDRQLQEILDWQSETRGKFKILAIAGGALAALVSSVVTLLVRHILEGG